MLRALPHDDTTILDRGVIGQTGVKSLTASYSRPYQSHASIGPSCALALMEGDKLTVWSHGQGMFPLRSALSKLLAMPLDQIRCIHTEGSGCYGHNGADDSAADRSAHRARFARPPDPRSVDARAGAWLGAVRSGDVDECLCVASMPTAN
ncbi:MAG: molybdopterin cofactor-binding domain-containing protein [Pseudolabrys sp.]